MQNPATVEDVQGLIERPLTPGERDAVPSWLDVALDRLGSRVPGLAKRTELPVDDPRHVSRDLVRRTLALMVERKVRNAIGARQYTVDEVSMTVDASNSAGSIHVTDEELAAFAVRGTTQSAGAYSVPLGL